LTPVNNWRPGYIQHNESGGAACAACWLGDVQGRGDAWPTLVLTALTAMADVCLSWYIE